MRVLTIGVTMTFFLSIGITFGITDVLEQAKVYLPFEGDATPMTGQAWKNQGTAGFGEGPSALGQAAGPSPTVIANGLKGQALDHSAMTTNDMANAYRWGTTEPDVLTPMEEGLSNMWSMTFTAWIRSNEQTDSGRITAMPFFQVNRRIDFLQTAINGAASGIVWLNSSTDPRGFPGVDHWRFIAITYDGTQTQNNLIYYSGSRYEPVRMDFVTSVNVGQLLNDPVTNEAVITVGNSGSESDRPFVGYIDELRIWGSQQQDSTGVLSIEQLERVRRFDAGVCDVPLAGDITGDCRVDLNDFFELAKNWLAEDE